MTILPHIRLTSSENFALYRVQWVVEVEGTEKEFKFALDFSRRDYDKFGVIELERRLLIAQNQVLKDAGLPTWPNTEELAARSSKESLSAPAENPKRSLP